MKKKLLYICEVQFPSTSAYAIHVTKMCEAFCNIGYQTTLITPYIPTKNDKIYRSFNIKKKFKFISIFKNSKKLNFILKIYFSLKVVSFLKKQSSNYQIISRSILSSIILSVFGYQNTLEVHHDVVGFTRLSFKFFKNLNFLNNINYIFLNKSLKNNFLKKENKYMILDDAVCLEDFKIKKNIKKLKKTCVYIGSFYKGKGFEFIINLAKICEDINFHLFGDKKFLNNNNYQKTKNIKIFHHIPYKKVPLILNNYDVALMPYSTNNYARGGIDISRSISPLKMFDYLAGKKIILASDLKVYRHILKHKYNSIVLDEKNIFLWKKYLLNIFKNLNKYNKLKNNAYKTAKKFTWKNRVQKINNKLFI